jgi:hypothetical protein
MCLCFYCVRVCMVARCACAYMGVLVAHVCMYVCMFLGFPCSASLLVTSVTGISKNKINKLFSGFTLHASGKYFTYALT